MEKNTEWASGIRLGECDGEIYAAYTVVNGRQEVEQLQCLNGLILTGEERQKRIVRCTEKAYRTKKQASSFAEKGEACEPEF